MRHVATSVQRRCTGSTALSPLKYYDVVIVPEEACFIAYKKLDGSPLDDPQHQAIRKVRLSSMAEEAKTASHIRQRSSIAERPSGRRRDAQSGGCLIVAAERKVRRIDPGFRTQAQLR